MSYKIKLNNIEVLLLEKVGSIKVTTKQQTVNFINQTIQALAELIENNFVIVSNFYNSLSHNEISKSDIDNVAVLVVMYYLYMYNLWKNQYKKQEKRDLKFNDKDFYKASTHDIILKYFRDTYPDSWADKSSILLQKQVSEVLNYFNERTKFYNK